MLRGIRRLDSAGAVVGLTPRPIPAAGSELESASYHFDDRQRLDADTLLYYLQDIDLFGRVTTHGPVAVDTAGPSRERQRTCGARER